MSNKQLASKIADEIYTALTLLKGQWVHSSDDFLPANVICDFHGEMKFKEYMASAAQGVLDEAESVR